MKKLLLIVATVITLAACGNTSVETRFIKQANDFLTLTANENLLSAYNSTSPLFKEEISFTEFENFITYFKLDKFQSSNWTEQFNGESEINGAPASQINGSFTTTENQTYKTSFDFIQDEQANWKIVFIEIHLDTPEASKNIQTLEAEDLVSTTISAFKTAIDEKNFVRFYEEKVSGLWKKEIKASELQEIFQSFIDAEVDLEYLEELTPTITEKEQLENNPILKLKGHYKNQENKLEFQLEYILEENLWLLTGINISLK